MQSFQASWKTTCAWLLLIKDFTLPPPKQYFIRLYLDGVINSAQTDLDMHGKCLQPMQLIYLASLGEKNLMKFG